LTDDREVKGIWMNDRNSKSITLKGKTLTIGEGGINADYSDRIMYISGGAITASGSELVVRSDTGGVGYVNEYGQVIYNSFALNSMIRDRGGNKINLVIKGEHKGANRGMISLGGSQSNIFTGSVTVEGRNNVLYLSKRGGATAIASKSIYVKSGGRLSLSGSNQISDESTVYLSGKASMFSFTGSSSPIM